MSIIRILVMKHVNITPVIEDGMRQAGMRQSLIVYFVIVRYIPESNVLEPPLILWIRQEDGSKIAAIVFILISRRIMKKSYPV